MHAVCADGDVRLTNGSLPSEGRIEICFNHQWGNICDKGWDDNDANVVCGQLGFSMTGVYMFDDRQSVTNVYLIKAIYRCVCVSVRLCACVRTHVCVFEIAFSMELM